MNYRKALKQDIPLLIHFRKTQLIQNGALEKNINDAQLRQFFEYHFDHQSIYQIIAYDQNKEIATGGIIFYNYPPSHVNQSGVVGYITNMFTYKEYRKQGIGTHILSLLEEEAKNRNVNALTLNATIHGSSLYKKCGFIKGHLETLEKKIK